jgi:glycine/sarcosine N-methyltransferase
MTAGSHRPSVQAPALYSDSDHHRIIFQVWDWANDRRYTFHLYLTRATPSGWSNFHGASLYRAILREEITAIVVSSGFANIRWLFPTKPDLISLL